MKRLDLRVLIISISISIVACLGCLLIVYRQQQKTVVVDVVKLFNSFNMKIELENQSAARLRVLTNRIDSIDKQLTILKYSRDTNSQRQMLNAYMAAKRGFDEAYGKSNQLINEMVWKRLNPLIDNYGKQESLHVIIGANGMGSVLYNDGYYDKTNELIQFVNKNYENEK